MNKYNLVNLITNMQPVPSIYNEGFSQYEDILYLINLTNSLITNQNLGADEITDLQNKKLAFVDYLLDIHNTRKIDDNGNFTGSWCGVDKPVHVEGGIDAVVIAQGEDIVINTNNIKDVMYLESLGFNLWGDANFYNSVTKKWYKDSGFTQLATDNTVALQNLINAFPNRKIRINGGKKFKISNTITISKPIYLEGDGYLASMIVVDGDFPSGQPVIKIQPTSIGAEPFIFKDFGVYSEETGVSGDTLQIINTATYGTNEIFIDRCYFQTRGNGQGINAINDDANINANGVPFIRVTNSEIWNGIKIQNCGDSCVIEKCNIKGKNIGIDISMVKASYGWSSNLSILNNNIVNEGGAIYLHNVRTFTVSMNNIEQQALLSGGYAVRIEQISDDAKALTNTMSTMEGNKIECGSPTSKAGGVKLVNVKNLNAFKNYVNGSPVLSDTFQIIGSTEDFNLVNCENVKIKDNELYISRGCIGVKIDATSKDCVVLGNSRHYFNSAEATDYSDLGIGTIGIPRMLTSTNFENYSTSYPPLYVYKDENGYCSIYGAMKVITGRGSSDFISGDTVIDALPQGFIPKYNTYKAESFINNSAVYGQAYIRAMQDGTVKFASATTAINVLYLNGGIRYKSA